MTSQASIALIAAAYVAGGIGHIVWQCNRMRESPYKGRLASLLQIANGKRLVLLFGIPARPFVLFSLHTVPALVWPVTWPLMARARRREQKEAHKEDAGGENEQ